MEPRWLWPFELIEKLGEGGMGVVYRARYSGNDRMVAVKLLPAEVAADSVLLARFERELDVLKQLRHPNIVRCFGGTCESAERFYAMELVEGGTLAELIGRKGRLSWEFVVDFALQMCEALQYAHEHGVIHRDVKPENFLLTRSGQIKLSDFGLAAIATSNRLTAAGRTVGTIQYMAPEQIRGKPPLTGRADLYALGCVLFEMLTGHPPYRGENAASVLQQHLSGPIPHVAAEVLECPLKLDEVVFRLMSKSPEDRPATAAEVSWRLEEILQPGRRAGSVDPDLFEPASTTCPATPVKNIPPTPSETILIPASNTRTVWGLGVTAVVLAVLCVQFWSQARTARTELRRAESQWVALLQRPESSVRKLALNGLAELGTFQSRTVEAVSAATRDADPGVRIAALQTMGRHATEFRGLQNDMLRIEKVDDQPEVRHLAGQTLSVLKQAPAAASPWRLVLWGMLLAILGAAVLKGRSLWHRLQQVAAS